MSWMEGTAERTRFMPGFADPAQEEKSWIKLEEKPSKKSPAGFDFQMLTLETLCEQHSFTIFQEWPKPSFLS